MKRAIVMGTFDLILGNNTYRITEEGRVFSLNYNRTGKIKELAYCSDKDGYLGVSLTNFGKCRFTKIHRLVAESFIPNPRALPCVNHLDGNKTNNRVDNLEWVTYKQNSRHARRTGLRDSVLGSNNHKSKLTEEEVLQIRKKRSKGEVLTKLAQEFDVGTSTIHSICRRETWTHI